MMNNYYRYLAGSAVLIVLIAGATLFSIKSGLVSLSEPVQAPPATAMANLDDSSERLARRLAEIERQLKARENQRSGDDDDDNNAELSAAMQETQEEIARLKETLAELQNSARTDHNDEQDSVQPIADLTQEQIEQRMHENQLAQVDLLDATFATEAPDLEWSVDTEQQVLDNFSHSDSPVAIDSIACAASLCRLEASTDGVTDAADIFRSIDENLGWEGEMFVSFDNQGLATAYLARPGQSLPRIEE